MLKLDELANRAGVSPRTVRYYIQRGVLPPPDFKGPDTSYGERHLHALRAIKRLQEDYLPLDAIASALSDKSDAELKKIAERGLGRASHPSHAREGAATGARAAVDAEAKRGERIRLGKGIELWVDDDADRALVDEIISLTQKRGHS